MDLVEQNCEQNKVLFIILLLIISIAFSKNNVLVSEGANVDYFSLKKHLEKEAEGGYSDVIGLEDDLKIL